MRTSSRAALLALSAIPILACACACIACANRSAKLTAAATDSPVTENRDLAGGESAQSAARPTPDEMPPPAATPAAPAVAATAGGEARPVFAHPALPRPATKSGPAAPPAAPMEALSDSLSAESAGLSATGGAGATARATRAAALPSAPGDRAAGTFRASEPAYAAASIAAGEWNDNANYRDFPKWLTTEAGLPFRAVDVSHRRFLVVRDEAGRAIPGCPVTVSDAGQRTVTLTTGPSGRALLFPRAEGLGEGLVTATATCAGSSVTRPVPLAANDGFVDLRLPVLRHLPPERTIDVAFILDTTGSMSEEIASVKSTIARVAAGLSEGNVKVRIGLVEYKDRGDAFITRVHPFATDGDARRFAASIAGVSAGGGGDTPESVNEGIHVALTRLDWQDSSVGRFAFLVGDAPPHLDYPQDFSYAADMKTAAHRGIQIFTVAASGMDPLGQVVWRQIAQYTNAANMFVLRGGAGPQSVGGGDPRSSCGGTHQNYSSGNLDALILSKINGELEAIEADPLRIAGLNEDENTKPCDQRVGMSER